MRVVLGMGALSNARGVIIVPHALCRRVSALCAAPGAGLENFGPLVVCGLRRMRQLFARRVRRP
jgi:hypothetical protein